MHKLKFKQVLQLLGQACNINHGYLCILGFHHRNTPGCSSICCSADAENAPGRSLCSCRFTESKSCRSLHIFDRCRRILSGSNPLNTRINRTSAHDSESYHRTNNVSPRYKSYKWGDKDSKSYRPLNKIQLCIHTSSGLAIDFFPGNS